MVVFRRCRWRYIPTELGVRLFREPDAGNPPVRFDERGEETELSQTGLRRRGESPANRHREATVTAPLLDSTHDPANQSRGVPIALSDMTIRPAVFGLKRCAGGTVGFVA